MPCIENKQEVCSLSGKQAVQVCSYFFQRFVILVPQPQESDKILQLQNENPKKVGRITQPETAAVNL